MNPTPVAMAGTNMNMPIASSETGIEMAPKTTSVATLTRSDIYEADGPVDLTGIAELCDLEDTARVPTIVWGLDTTEFRDVPTTERLAGEVLEPGCDVVLCDISPMGVAVAEAAGRVPPESEPHSVVPLVDVLVANETEAALLVEPNAGTAPASRMTCSV